MFGSPVQALPPSDTDFILANPTLALSIEKEKTTQAVETTPQMNFLDQALSMQKLAAAHHSIPSSQF
jgi:hypothetical protein